jgi:hypothetical protein
VVAIDLNMAKDISSEIAYIILASVTLIIVISNP